VVRIPSFKGLDPVQVPHSPIRIPPRLLSAYCLMPDHYHLLIHTPLGNLSRCMRHINAVYTQRYNRTHGCDGQLFRGRLKAILVGGKKWPPFLGDEVSVNRLKALFFEDKIHPGYPIHGLSLPKSGK
jgi:hypothetical protein